MDEGQQSDHEHPDEALGGTGAGSTTQEVGFVQGRGEEEEVDARIYLDFLDFDIYLSHFPHSHFPHFLFRQVINSICLFFSIPFAC